MALCVLFASNGWAQVISSQPPGLQPENSAENTAEAKLGDEEIFEWRGSLLFEPDAINQLRQALEIYKMQGGQVASGDYLSNLENVPSMEQVVTRAPYFYLGSIIYSSTGEWFLWLNGKKISAVHNPQDKNLSIDHISTMKAVFAWRPPDAKTIGANWRRRQQIDRYIGRTSSNVAFDEENGIVTFTLRPNQTFFSHTMQVVEGRLPPSERVPKGFALEHQESEPDTADPSISGETPALSKVPAPSPDNGSLNLAPKTLPEGSPPPSNVTLTPPTLSLPSQ